jgi:hypothetical protein
MGKSWVLCVLMGTISLASVAWGQAAATPAPSSMPKAPGAAQGGAPPAAAPEVAEDAVVLTIKGVCPEKDGKKPEDCKTTLTREEFEKIASGLAPAVTPQLKRQLASALPKFMAMSEAAKKKGLEDTDAYKETLRVAKMQILTTQLQRNAQEEAEKISPEEIEAYYKKNPEAYEQYSLDRLFIPRNKQVEPDKNDDDEKLTDEQQKAKADAAKAKQEQGQKELDALAETLQKRAAAGEDFLKLQKEAYAAAGMKMDAPTVNLPAVRRTGLPPAHAAVFDLKVGEVSKVISDNGGHYIYKVVSKQVLPLDDKVKAEIHNTLKSQRLKEIMDGYQNSYSVEQNEAYFGPPSGPGPGRPGPPHMRPMPGQPQMAPPSKPN